MPGFVLHQGATVQCMHGGAVAPTMPYPRVQVARQKVTVQPVPYAVTGCALTGTSNPPCVIAQWTTGALRLTCGGMPLLLRDSQATCMAPGTGVLVIMTQVRIQGK